MFKVYKTQCKNCLLSKDRIVPSDRANQIIKDCVKEQTHFICHKASMNDEDVCCRKFYDEIGHKINKIRIFERIRAVEFVDQTDAEKLPSYLEMKNGRYETL